MDKAKSKIKKLLELSLSNNENEAALALKQAMVLMNKHNITKEEVYGQKMVSELLPTRFYRIPAWYVELNNLMARISGCYMVYSTGDSYCNERGKIQLTGRQRDVENAIYLITFLARELEKHADAYKHHLTKLRASQIRARVTSYRTGFIRGIYKKMLDSQEKFFSSESQAKNQLVFIDTETKVNDAKHYYTHELGQEAYAVKRSNRFLKSAYGGGVEDASKLEVNNAINNQNEIRLLH